MINEEQLHCGPDLCKEIAMQGYTDPLWSAFQNTGKDEFVQNSFDGINLCEVVVMPEVYEDFWLRFLTGQSPAGSGIALKLSANEITTTVSALNYAVEVAKAIQATEQILMDLQKNFKLIQIFGANGEFTIPSH